MKETSSVLLSMTNTSSPVDRRQCQLVRGQWLKSSHQSNHAIPSRHFSRHDRHPQQHHHHEHKTQPPARSGCHHHWWVTWHWSRVCPGLGPPRVQHCDSGQNCYTPPNTSRDHLHRRRGGPSHGGRSVAVSSGPQRRQKDRSLCGSCRCEIWTCGHLDQQRLRSVVARHCRYTGSQI
jgi:hypothetical protein